MNRFTLKALFSCIPILIIAVSAGGCATARQAQSDGQFERKISVKVESTAAGELPSVPWLLLDKTGMGELKSRRPLEMVARKLRENQPHVMLEAAQAPSDRLDVEVAFNTIPPAVGASILGNLTPYRHTLILKGSRKGKQVFLTEVTAGDEYETVDRLLPVLVVVMGESVGENLASPKTYGIRRSDPQVQALLE